ncbi:uncharacterized protein L3040_001751 [Drepanopeziza brunnea f. sp. 'multigermtubi']|uniref:N-acetyltransferase domain-containing protein n=2 Tax=Drepanopeziza brunnea f. sp. 'multigermtubi' TaxID=698441 RepID=K1XS19_MARBU|nr:uncharacterized protein MBM_06600 [Drepanopeziza brunnea f. sp. 'multigermtubi' MB_m1]EKD15384.1 hypothetical protein MBM_06600 [Drepanopeziza brunnea f. sp. 'multigermtubi' MB_m1]KAJ5051991.1 hypothetical protein L3040_001751 [Drepanopeziza brunnea f. sp. 'multigermtubi']
MPSSTVSLIAWDPESPAHVGRLFQQRVACGWKSDCVESWRHLQRQGKMAIQWVVLSDDDDAAKLSRHTLRYPMESTPILDTALALGSKPRAPTSAAFIPIGHISLDSECAFEEQADASRGTYCITSFYISAALQGSGLGRAAMDRVEREAVKEPLHAKVLTLDTLSNSSMSKETFEEMGLPEPKMSNQDWYERRGYKAWKLMRGDIKWTDSGNKDWFLDRVLMRKTVA